MLKQRSSVLIVSSDGSSNKKVLVPTYLLNNWKKILFFSLLFICCGCGLTVYLLTNKNVKHYSSIYDQKINELRKEKYRLSVDGVSSEMDLLEVKKSYNMIDSAIDEINQKMRKRGLKEIAPRNVGGPIETEDDLAELTKYYETTVKDIDRKLAYIPVGKPHNGRITSRYGYRRNPFTNRGRELHSGVDLKGRTGDPVRSTASGRVTFAGYMGNYGYVVMVDHTGGFETRYAHLSKLRVKKGDRIEVGRTIGLVGSTGRSTGPHLHYEILHRGKKINPEKYFHF